MKTKLILSLLLTSAISIAFAEEITLDSARPVVIKSVPEAGSTAVDSSTTEIRVTFSKEMQPGAWSWGMIDKETYPGTSEAPKYLDDKRTCVLPVKLQPGKTYAVWINTEKLHNFKDVKGQIAVPYLLVFKTRD
jgi:RNA polymerase sigma-70 factor (ECF subfamily)